MIHWLQQSDVVVIHLRGGKKIKPAVGNWSLARRLQGNSRQLRIQELIDRARSNADDGPAVAIFAAFVLFAYLVRG